MLLQAIKVLNMIKLYGKPIRVNKVSRGFTLSTVLGCVLIYCSATEDGILCSYENGYLTFVMCALHISRHLKTRRVWMWERISS